MKYILGIDTSCYTTSLALLDREKNLLWEKRMILNVPLGKRGLAQSEGVFQHVKNLPLLFSALKEDIGKKEIMAIAASTRPRPLVDSYMPVFKVGEGHGRAVAAILDVPFVSVSHQEGHLQAGIWSSGEKIEPPFLAVHISGGTTELLLTKKGEKNLFETKILGTSTDLHAGQLVDRVGVALGLSFPAGKQMDLLASQGKASEMFLPSAVNNYNISFSGAETRALKFISQGKDKKEVALVVLKCIANSLEKVIRKAVEEQKIKTVLLVGGVAANSYLRQRLKQRLEHRAVGASLYFAQPEFSSDNAVGTALSALYLI